MTDQPTPTEHEEERAPEEMDDHEAMQYPGRENPAEEDRANREVPPEPENPPRDVEVHDA